MTTEKGQGCVFVLSYHYTNLPKQAAPLHAGTSVSRLLDSEFELGHERFFTVHANPAGPVEGVYVGDATLSGAIVFMSMEHACAWLDNYVIVGVALHTHIREIALDDVSCRLIPWPSDEDTRRRMLHRYVLPSDKYATHRVHKIAKMMEDGNDKIVFFDVIDHGNPYSPTTPPTTMTYACETNCTLAFFIGPEVGGVSRISSHDIVGDCWTNISLKSCAKPVK